MELQLLYTQRTWKALFDPFLVERKISKKGSLNEMKHSKIMTAKHLLLVKISWYKKRNWMAKERSIETQQTLKAVTAVVWTHTTNLISNKMTGAFFSCGHVFFLRLSDEKCKKKFSLWKEPISSLFAYTHRRPKFTERKRTFCRVDALLNMIIVSYYNLTTRCRQGDSKNPILVARPWV